MRRVESFDGGVSTGADAGAGAEAGAEAEGGTGIGAEVGAGAGSDRVSAGGSDGVGFAAVSMQQPWEPDPLRAYGVDGNRQPGRGSRARLRRFPYEREHRRDQRFRGPVPVRTIPAGRTRLRPAPAG